MGLTKIGLERLINSPFKLKGGARWVQPVRSWLASGLAHLANPSIKAQANSQRFGYP